MRVVLYATLTVSAVLLWGCSASDYGQVMKKPDSSYEIVAQGDSAAQADSNALKAAELTCKEAGRSGSFVTLHRDNAYQGAFADAAQHRAATDLLSVLGTSMGGAISRDINRSSSKTTYSKDGSKATTRTRGTHASVNIDPASGVADLNKNAFASHLIIRCE